MEVLQESRTKVNGKFLAEYSGKPISILGKVIKVHPNGSTVEIKSTDNLLISVILNEPIQEALPSWIEVRGTGQGKCHVIAQHLLPMPDEVMAKFDSELFDDVLTIINTCNNPWVNG